MPFPPSLYKTCSDILLIDSCMHSMLMNLAQLLYDVCKKGGILLLPPLDADPLRDTRADTVLRTCKRITYHTNSRRAPTCEWHNRPRPALVNFADVFRVGPFERHLRPHCMQLGGRYRFIATSAPSSARVQLLKVYPLHATWWDMHKYAGLLQEVYAAVRPSRIVEPLLDELVRQAHLLAGPRWAAIHLPIEMDWWWSTDFCQGRPDENYTRRCYTPSEISRLADPTLRSQNVSGVVLMFAHDKVASPIYPWHSRGMNRTGPHVCHCDFGPRTFKLQLNSSIPYLFRNAAELFLASHSPTIFVGNSYSTFAKGVALMRAAVGHASFAYDCALAEASQWKPREMRATGRIVRLHPGFPHLRPIGEPVDNLTSLGNTYPGGAAIIGMARLGIDKSHCGTSSQVMVPALSAKCSIIEHDRGDC